MRIDLINPGNSRYYFMLVTENLFGETEIIISRGSANRKKATMRYLSFQNCYEAMKEFYKLVCLRLNHGYVEHI